MNPSANKYKDAIWTVDAVLSDGKRILLIRRAKEPFKDKLVLPGGHVENTDSSFAAACRRELLEEVGLDIKLGRYWPLCTLESPGRDPRPGFRVSFVFHIMLTPEELNQARAGSDAAELVIHPMVKPLTQDMLGFDHFDAFSHFYHYLELLESFDEDDGWPGIP
jgi:8-oxo-dGTP diphosphatase